MRAVFIASILAASLLPAVARAESLVDQFVTAASTQSATSGMVELTELLPNPLGSDTGHEWIELHNPTNTLIAVGGLKLQRQSGAVVMTLPADQTISPGGYLVVTSLSASLLNTGDTLVLLSGQLELERITYGGDGAEGAAWSKLPSGWVWAAQPTPGVANVTVATPLPSALPSPPAPPSIQPLPTTQPVTTPAPPLTPSPPTPSPSPAAATVPINAASPQPSAVPSPAPSPTTLSQSQLWINELLANPLGTDANAEWIELYNRTDQTLDLTQLIVVRENGSVLYQASQLTIPANGYVQLKPLAATLVNSGDTISLSVAGTVVDQVVYDGEGAEGETWIRLDQATGEWTDQPTPGGSNVTRPVVVPTESPTVANAVLAVPATTKSVTTKAKSAGKKTATKTASKTAAKGLPKSGTDPTVYLLLVPLMGAAVYCYKRWIAR